MQIEKISKTLILPFCVIVAWIMLGVWLYSCYVGTNGGQITAKGERGFITDRNGLLLVANDTTGQDSIFGFVQRTYPHPAAAQLLGYTSMATPADILYDDECDRKDVFGRTGLEKTYDGVLRGKNGESGKNLKLTIDYELQKYGEELMAGKVGSIVAIEPSTGEVLCMVSSPGYNPQALVGTRAYTLRHQLQQDKYKPMLNRCVMGQYSPGCVFKAAQALVLLSEGIITPETTFSCVRGFHDHGLSITCHGHSSPLSIVAAISTSCNGYFCHGFLDMMGHSKYVSVHNAMTKWSEYMHSLGLGYQLGVDLPNERRGLIPVADYYEKAYKGAWNGRAILGNAIGQGEVKATPLQLANLSAIIANGGSYFIPHVVKRLQSGDIDAKFKSMKSSKVTKEACDVVAQGMRMSAMGGVCKVLSRMPIEACGMSGAASSSGNENSIFIGYAPVENPKIAVAVIVEGGGWGGKFAVPVGGLVMEQYLNDGLSEESKRRSKALQEEHIEYNMD